MSNIITCEQVSNGHPDKICDQIADAIVTDCLQHDPDSRVAIEVLIKDNHVMIAGELTSTHEPCYANLVDAVFERIGKSSLGYDVDHLDIQILVSRQSPDIAQGVDLGGAGDQGMMFGYATNETPELLPLPYVLATRFLEKLEAYRKGAGGSIFRADAKAQVSFDYEAWEIRTFLCSTQTAELTEAEEEKVKQIVRELMMETTSDYALNTDFEILVNPTGRFVIGGPYADSGVTGRKLACDTYGGVGHIGGGAMSGKDPSKVDRSGAYAARRIAVDIVRAGYADRCEVQIAYAIGVADPVSIHVETFGTEHISIDEIENRVKQDYDLTPYGIIKNLGLLDTDYNRVSSYGHFGKNGLPWE